MTTLSLSDLRYLFYGGGSAAEYAFLQGAATAGISAGALVKLGYNGNNSPEGVVDAPFGSVYTDNLTGQHYEKHTASGNLNGWVLIDVAGAANLLNLRGALAGTDMLSVGIAADVQNRFTLNADGSVEWSSGAAVPDTNLYRSAIDVLKTDDNFQSVLDQVARVGAATQVTSGSVGGNAGLLFGSASDANLYRSAASVLKTDGALQSVGDQVANVVGEKTAMTLVSGNSGVVFGALADTNLYRLSAGVLRTDSFFQSASTVTARVGTANQAVMGLTATGVAGPGITFGSGSDVNLYRAALDQLKTDDGLLVDDRLAVGSAQALQTGVTAALKTGANSSLVVGANVDGTAAAGGIHFGLSRDTNLYRALASGLKTDSLLITANDFISRHNAATDTRVGAFGTGGTAGILFGSGSDTVLYRGAANQLKTDDRLNLSCGSLVGATDAGPNLEGGTGAPNNANGTNGDFYFRLDGGAGTSLYMRRAGAWVGIV